MGRSGRWPTVFSVVVLRVCEGQVGVCSAGQARAPSGLGVAATPQSDRMFWGHDAVGFCVRVWAHTDRVIAVWQPHVGPVCGHVRWESLSEPEVSKRKVHPWRQRMCLNRTADYDSSCIATGTNANTFISISISNSSDLLFWRSSFMFVCSLLYFSNGKSTNSLSLNVAYQGWDTISSLPCSCSLPKVITIQSADLKHQSLIIWIEVNL